MLRMSYFTNYDNKVAISHLCLHFEAIENCWEENDASLYDDTMAVDYSHKSTP